MKQSDTEHERELERMQLEVERINESSDSNWRLTPYEGRTDDIDIVNEPLFCPYCNYDKPLKLNASKTAVSCANPRMIDWCGEYCDYEYKLTSQRAIDGTFWTSGYKYPQTQRQVLESKLTVLTKEADGIPKRRRDALKAIDARRDELADNIASIKAELASLGDNTKSN